MNEQNLKMRDYWSFRSILLFIFLSISLGSQAQLDSEKPTFSLFLIGDAGAEENSDSLLRVFHLAVNRSVEKSAVIFLGDNIYPLGLSNKNNESRSSEEQILDKQLLPLKEYNGKTFVIPGNHDYARGRKYGYKHLLNQQQYIDSTMGDSTFAPFNACPGPEEIKLSDEVTLILMDTEWLLYAHQEKLSFRGCGCNSSDEFFVSLEDIIRRNYDKKIIIAGHHPVQTYGNHGGKFNLGDHVFPLTHVKDWMYLPLPIIGSLYPFSRQMGLSSQDINHPVNKKMRTVFEELFRKHPNLIYASGHEHSLQYSYKDSVHYVVSGSGSKSTYVRKGKYSEFVSNKKGFVKVEYYNSGKVQLKYFDRKRELYIKTIETENSTFVQEKSGKWIYPDSIVVSASTQYDDVRKSNKTWLGENYRKEWAAPIKVPIFNLEKKGLRIIKKGGGMATLSLRLEDEEGNQYTLRTVNKNTDKAVPEELRRTIAKDVVQDQTSASHPYGALVVPPLADAVGVYHTNPYLVYVPNDPAFGVYQIQVANTMFLFEERPTKNTGNIKSFGNAKKIYGTPKVISKLKKDSRNFVDYKFTVRSRLFDMVLGDWDRHDDQWRWAVFKYKKGAMYRPIPRDRDQVFFVNQGILPKLASRKWIMPKFEGFNDNIRWAEGFNFNARYFDRYFLSQASKEDWLSEAEFIQENLTDSVIEKSIRSFPDTIFNLHGSEIIEKLKLRRDLLKEIAISHYEALSKHTSITGSDKREQFNILKFQDGSIQILVKRINKKGNVKNTIYDRTFKEKETKEIRLYGLGGVDQFLISGNYKTKIRVRAIAGDGTDKIIDNTSKGTNRNVLIYDVKNEVDIEKGKSLKYKTSNNPNVNNYNRNSIKYNSFFPLVYLGYTPDDGVLLGGGFIHTTHQFRRNPYATRQQFIGGISATTGAFKVKYRLQVTEAIGKLEFDLNANLQSPRNSNFYGVGNESLKDPDEELSYYRFNYSDFKIDPLLSWDISSSHNVKFGLALRQTHVDEDRFTSGGYISDTEWDRYLDDPHGTQSYIGIQTAYEFDTRDNILIPRKGSFLCLGAGWLDRLNGGESNLTYLNGELNLFKTIKLPRDLTFGLRLGGAHNAGDFHYLLANKIGGKSSLRGYRRDRFYGRSSLFNTVEVRYDLYNIRTVVFPFTIGIIGFHDVGRVWINEESSDLWHQSAGGGVYIKPADSMALSVQFAKSKEIFAVYFDLGFSF